MDKVIGELVRLCVYPTICRIASYSLVSRAWVTYTQQHIFEFIGSHDSEELEKWCRKIEPDPAGVSRHTRHLSFHYIDTLTGIETNIRAFTRVEEMGINRCDFLSPPSVVECFAPMSSSLTELKVRVSPATLHIIASMLAALLQLK